MRRVVVGILLMILLLPGLDVDYGLWGRYIGVDRGGLSMLHDIAVYGGGNGTAAFAQALQVCCTCAVACSLRCDERCVLKAGQSWCRSVRCCGCVLTWDVVCEASYRAGLEKVHNPSLVAMQAFYGTVQYRLGTNPTSQLFFLSVANETLIPYPDGEARRYDELWSMQYAR